ncbi:hypothetical protein ScPMuIL_001422 [Solemya velum]
MALTLSEDIIRSRVNLKHDNLEDVKSLSLPGTYHEKVVSLGSALRKFSRLKHLDLSRNAISSLQGLEHLKLLERLNLYYNNVTSLEELKHLKYNTHLKELDLRLNPITRTEPDFRLYLIHMLPSLQKLDDRSVRDRERQAALIHFSSSQATEMTYHNREPESQPKRSHPRAEFVAGMGRGVTALDDDDVAILDLIARTGGDLSKARAITGSAANEPAIEEYSIQGLKSLDGLTNGDAAKEYQVTKHPTAEIDDVMAAYLRRYPNIPAVTLSSTDDGVQAREQDIDDNLKFEDEADAYTKFRGRGYFTPHPGAGDVDEANKSVSMVQTERDSYPAEPRLFSVEQDRYGDIDQENFPNHRRTHSVLTQDVELQGSSESEQKHLQRSSGEKGASSESPRCREFLFRLLDLVDRYWNGTKSLHKHGKFKSLAFGIIDNFNKQSREASIQIEKDYLESQLSRIQDDNARLRTQSEAAKSNLLDSAANETQLKETLHQAYSDVELLRDQLKKYVSENKILQDKIQHQDSTMASSTSTVNQSQLDDLARHNQILNNEVKALQHRLKQFGQLQELTGMLQDSHKSLVQTNEHLLKELQLSKQQHQQEAHQPGWNHNEGKISVNNNASLSQESTEASAIFYGKDES